MIILDRFEGNSAIVEIDYELVSIEKKLVDKKVKEGDVLKLIEGIYYKDQEATEQRKQDINNKFKDMWED